MPENTQAVSEPSKITMPTKPIDTEQLTGLLRQTLFADDEKQPAQAETETEEVKEGGVNDYVYKLPKGTKYPNLILKKGMTISNELWDWHRKVVAGKIKRKTIYIIL